MVKAYKKYLQMIFMIIPMIMLMLHDMIPHHHHDLQKHDGHQSVHAHHEHHHHHNNYHHEEHHEHDFLINLSDNEFIAFFTHHHDEEEEACCILTHHRVKKQANFQIFLKTDSVNYHINEKFCRKKYIVRNDRLLPDRVVPINQLRGPPSIALSHLG